MTKIKIICKRCKNEFYDWKSRHRTYCSTKCVNLSNVGKLPWNTGKKMSVEHCKMLSKVHLGKKKPHIGVPRTPETRKKISDYWKTHKRVCSEETRMKHSKNMIHKMKTGIICNEDTIPERIFENYLLFNDVLYLKQFKYDLGIADFWLPEFNAIVEIDGLYWHSKPKAIERDIRQTAWLEHEGYIVHRFTDKQINQDVESCVDEVLKNGKNKI